MLDTSRLNLADPHPIWSAAGSNPVSIRKATVVTWLLLNVYRTGERLYQMKKAKTAECIQCLAPLDNQLHFALQCMELEKIRSEYLVKFIKICPTLTKYIENKELLLLILLDPFSPLVPSEVRESWSDSESAYKISRDYFYDIHRKREKILEAKKGPDSIPLEPEAEDKTNIIISMYEM